MVNAERIDIAGTAPAHITDMATGIGHTAMDARTAGGTAGMITAIISTAAGIVGKSPLATATDVAATEINQ